MSVSEKSLITRVRQHARRRHRNVVAGIGDDCAVLRIPRGHEVLVTTDFSLEGMHFLQEWHAPEVIGHRCLTRGLSDIAAMGGEPIAAFLSLALPRDVEQKWVDGFLKGLLELADSIGVTLAGGDTAESPDGILADIVVVGSVPKGKAIRRCGAKPGDRIYVTGELGVSAGTLELLRAGKKVRSAECAQHFRPMPRIEVGRMLREKELATAMIDISDGLSTDLHHICDESEVGAEIRADDIPLGKIGKKQVDLNFALHGGDEYELLFSASPSKRVPQKIAGVRITEIGRVTSKRNGVVLDDNGVKRSFPARGWEHFERT